MRRLFVWCCCAVLLTACYDTEETPRRSEHGLPTGRVLIGAREDPVFVDVEVAETAEHRTQGLMNRESLPPDAGMMFVYFEPTLGGFWMKDTTISLSVAFIDEEERIVDIIDMDPCKKDPCRSYVPETEYVAALEVNQGMFEEWGVGIGDTVRLLR